MALDIDGLFDAVMSHASASGYFDVVNGHESVSPPPSGGLVGDVWVDDVVPVRSGLDSTSTLVVMCIRLKKSATSMPLDAIDPDIIKAVDALCAAYVGDFTLGGLLRNIDIRGAHGQPLRVRAGYLPLDGSLQRVMTIWLPCIVNDLWTEAP